MVIQGLHDRQPDGADVLEGLLGRRLAAGRVLPEFAHHVREARVGLLPLLAPRLVEPLPLLVGALPLLVGASPVLIRALAIGSHLEAQIAQLCQDQPAARIEAPPVLSVAGHRHNLAPRETDFNVAARIQRARVHREAGTRAWAETTIAVVFNSDEERLSPSSKDLIQAQARRAHSVGILEPARPGGEYVMARKGAGSFQLEITGKAAHAGNQPELGASAIGDLAQKIVDLHALTNFETGTTVNVGVIQGGERPNVVADRAYAEIDLRAWTQDEAERAIARMREIAERPRVPGTTSSFRGALNFPPWPPGHPGTARLLEIMSAAGREIGVEVRAIRTGGGSDGNHTSHVAPTIDGLGPKGSRAHSDEEFVELDTLLERTKMIALFLERWAAEFPVE